MQGWGKESKLYRRWSAAGANMQRSEKQGKICRTEILQMSICEDEESKINYTEVKYCRCEYAEARQAK